MILAFLLFGILLQPFHVWVEINRDLPGGITGQLNYQPFKVHTKASSRIMEYEQEVQVNISENMW